MATALSVPAVGIRRAPHSLRWTVRSSLTPGDHHDSVYVRWLTADGRALLSTLTIEHDDEGNLALILTSGPELDSDALDALYDDVARRIGDGPSPWYEVQTADEVVNGCSHPYAKAMRAQGWTFAPGIVCSYCGEVLS